MPDEQPLDMKADGESPTQSSCFDYVFSMICFACIIVPLALGIAADKSLALGYLYAWLFLIVRVHLHIWWLGGLTAFLHLAWRFPATWLNTVTFYPIFVGCKLIQWIFCEILYFDPVGQLYKCKGTGLTLERYARMTRDLDKPLLFRKGDTYMNFTIYPFMLSTQLACNIYSMVPYTGFGDRPLLVCITVVFPGSSIIPLSFQVSSPSCSMNIIARFAMVCLALILPTITT
jgi:hypothetical protein